MSSDYYDYDAYDELAPAEQAPHSPWRAYLDESDTPLTALIFTLPLFAFYHIGLWWMKTFRDQGWANAADVIIAWALGRLGWAGPLLSFVTVVVVFILLQQRESVPWRLPPMSTFGLMVGESLVFAIPVVVLNQVVYFLRTDLTQSLQANWPSGGAAGAGGLAEAARGAGEVLEAAGGGEELSLLAKVALSCGAGVYEEFLFRLVLMGVLAGLLRLLFGMRGQGLYLASAIIQALLFSAFHHLPGSEDPFEMGKFAFRAAAGVYFAYLYWERGFGIAAGAHAGYDLFTVVAQN